MKAIVGNAIAGGSFIGRKAILFEGSTISDIVDPKVARENLAAENIEDYGSSFVSAGFIDLQLNGAGGHIFQFSLEDSAADQITTAVHNTGTIYYLPAISATNIEEYRLIRNFSRNRKYVDNAILGLNFEGPFLNPSKPGFGLPDCVGPQIMDHKDVYYDLIEDMCVMMTIAPEAVERDRVLEMLRDGIILSLGHSNASASDARKLIDVGVSMCTHIFNGMPPIQGREPSITGVCLAADKISCSMILDGYHLHKETVKLVWKSKHPRKICLISDGMSPLGGASDEFSYRDIQISSKDSSLVDENGNLSGTKKSLLEMCAELRDITGARLDKVIDTVTRAPAAVLSKDNEIGDIRVGMKASFTVFDNEFSLRGAYLEGQKVS